MLPKTKVLGWLKFYALMEIFQAWAMADAVLVQTLENRRGLTVVRLPWGRQCLAHCY